MFVIIIQIIFIIFFIIIAFDKIIIHFYNVFIIIISIIFRFANI